MSDPIIPVVMPKTPVVNITLNPADLPTPVKLQMTAPGPAGPQGAPGPEGPQGLPGPPIPDYVHTQIAASTVWEITHSLNKYPTVTIIDSGGSIVIGEVDYIDQNRVTVTFSVTMSGTASLQ